MTDRAQQDATRRRASALGSNLVLAREAAGLTQTDMAKRAGTSRATIAQIESGGGDPRLSTLGAIADALGVGTFVLLLGKSDIEKLVALVHAPSDLVPVVPAGEDADLLAELATSQLPADQRRAARLSSDLVARMGFTGSGAAVGAAIGAALMPGLGTVVGAFVGGLRVLMGNRRRGGGD